MPYALVMTPEVRAWLHDLRKRDRASAIQVGQAIGMLLEAGPELGRPLADRVHHTRLSNLKELRPGSAGRSEIRILYIFDPRRNAVLLVAGDKAKKERSEKTFDLAKDVKVFLVDGNRKNKASQEGKLTDVAEGLTAQLQVADDANLLYRTVQFAQLQRV